MYLLIYFFVCIVTWQKLTQPHCVLLSLCRINSQEDKTEQEEDGEQRKKGRGQGKKDIGDLDSDDEDFSDPGDDDDDEEEDFSNDSEPKKAQNRSDVLPDVSRVKVKDWRQTILVPNRLFLYIQNKLSNESTVWV